MRHRSNRWIQGLMWAAIVLTFSAAGAQAQQAGAKGPATPERPARINGRPNFNGIWQALNTANWNLEDHSAEGLKDIWQLGAIAAIPAGQSVVRAGGD